MSNDKLEQEAKRYAVDVRFENEGEDVANYYNGDVKEAFVAGAEYQAKEDLKILYTDEEVKAIILQAVGRFTPFAHENLKGEIASEFYVNVRKQEPKKFYCVCNIESKQGLWYNFDGTFTGMIHNEFNFCQNSDLKMDFDPTLVGWLSTCDTIEGVWQWFTQEDVLKLQELGWYLHEFEATQYRFYDRFQHHVIKQETSKIIRRIEI